MDMQQAVASFRFEFFGLIVQTCHNIRKNLGGYSTVQLFLKEPFSYLWYFIQTDIYLLYPLGILCRILILPDADPEKNKYLICERENPRSYRQKRQRKNHADEMYLRIYKTYRR